MRGKEPSNHTASPERRFTLPKSQILRGRRNFEELFASSSFLAGSTVNLRYSASPDSSQNLLVGFIAPKRIGNAVKRNHAKRLMREAYRLNQHILTKVPEINQIGLRFVFMAKQADLTFTDVQKDVIQLLNTLRSQLFPPSTTS